MPRTTVEFFDITADSAEWYTQHEVEHAMPMIVAVMGYVVFEDEHFIKIASMYSPSSEKTGILTIIPKGCITTRVDF